MVVLGLNITGRVPSRGISMDNNTEMAVTTTTKAIRDITILPNLTIPCLLPAKVDQLRHQTRPNKGHVTCHRPFVYFTNNRLSQIISGTISLGVSLVNQYSSTALLSERLQYTCTAAKHANHCI